MANNNPYHLIQCKFSPTIDVIMVCLLKPPLNFDHDNFIASLMTTSHKLNLITESTMHALVKDCESFLNDHFHNLNLIT